MRFGVDESLIFQVDEETVVRQKVSAKDSVWHVHDCKNPT